MLLEINQPSYFGFGIGSKMKDADVWLLEILDAGKSLRLTDSYSVSKRAPPSDESGGGTDDLVFLGCAYNQNRKTKIKFKRKQHTGDRRDKDLLPTDSLSVIWAYGPSTSDTTVTDHKQHKGQFTLTFRQGAFTDASNQNQGFYPYHKWVNFVAWGFLVDLAILIARYWKTYRYRIELHAVIMTLVVLPSLVVGAMMLIPNLDLFNFSDFQARQLRVKWHFIIGLLVSLLVILQMVGGYLLKRKIMDLNANEEVSEKPTIHQILGHSIYLFAKINVGLGIFLQPDPQLYLPCAALYGFIFFWRIGFELLYRNNKAIGLFVGSLASKAQTHPASLYESFVNHVDQSDFIPADESKLWCIFNNSIIDLQNQIHPGGQYIWKAIQGREVSRYIFGAYSLEGTSVPPYQHSKYALAMLKKQTIGTLSSIPFYKERALSSATLFNTDQPGQWWTLERTEPLTETISYFGFHCESLTFRLTLDSVDSFGRYFLISSEDEKISTRPYTMILCMAKPNVEFRNQLIKLADSIINKQQANQVPIPVPFHHELPFIIKKYNSINGMSEFIHLDNRQGKYKILGPYGVSFGLPEQGHFAIICGGTGLLPFLDLLDYFLRYTIYEALLRVAGAEIAQYTNISKTQYRKYAITLILAVKSEDELIGKDIYFSILNLQKYLAAPNFRMILKGNFKSKNIQTIKDRFDVDFFQRELKEIDQITRFLICGPPAMNKDVPQALKALFVPPKKIHLV